MVTVCYSTLLGKLEGLVIGVGVGRGKGGGGGALQHTAIWLQHEDATLSQLSASDLLELHDPVTCAR